MALKSKLGALFVAVGTSLLASSLSHAATVGERAFTVANYPVEAAAKDAVAAKERAIGDGQQAAFRSLLKRIVPVTAYKSLDRLKAVKASDVLDGFAVRTETNSPTRYIASLDFSFQPDAVRQLLQREGVPFIETQAQRTVLIPVTREAPAAPGDAKAAAPVSEFRPATGSWNDVWKGLDLDNTLTPVKVEALRTVIHSDTLKMALSGDDNGTRILAGEYKSDEIVVAIAEADPQAKRLDVTLTGRDAVGPINWKRSYRVADGDMAYTMELAAVVTLGVLEGRWKAVGSGAARDGAMPGPSGPEIVIGVEFQSLAEWNDIRGRLLAMSGVDDMRIGAVSARAAEVTLRYPGGGGSLANDLSPQGLALRNAGGSGWVLRAGY